MPKTNTRTIDAAVLADAARQLEAAARRLRAIENDPNDDDDRNRARLSVAIANIHAALARIEQ